MIKNEGHTVPPRDLFMQKVKDHEIKTPHIVASRQIL